MKEQIITALRALDPLNENHWTGQGFARVDVVAKAASLPDLKRQDITEAAPDFNRDTATGYQFQDYAFGDILVPSDMEIIPYSTNTSSPVESVSISIDVESLVSERDALQLELEGVRVELNALRAREADLTSRLDIINTRIDRECPEPNTAQQIQAYQRRQQELTARTQASAKPTQSPLDVALSVNAKRQKQRPSYPVKQ